MFASAMLLATAGPPFHPRPVPAATELMAFALATVSLHSLTGWIGGCVGWGRYAPTGAPG